MKKRELDQEYHIALIRRKKDICLKYYLDFLNHVEVKFKL
jgi:hypothetical protein